MPEIPLPTLTPTHRTRPTTLTTPTPAIPRLWRFPAELASVARARAALQAALRGAPTPLHSPQLSYELRLIASELVTNAIRHGCHPDPVRAAEENIELLFWTADGHHWLAVSDPGSGRPALAATADTRDPLACGGRGLVLVEALSDIWAVVPRPTRGKTVVAGIRLGLS
ncbi:ATP-binding protein [Kitasatospora sp. LaBMicrA B282]|uniref:ATP-binding protein n=1 Tax=Kitasatospora sp. LaBMicrA B282 TaxID=3420949 RepID=UPI003D09B926